MTGLAMLPVARRALLVGAAVALHTVGSAAITAQGTANGRGATSGAGRGTAATAKKPAPAAATKKAAPTPPRRPWDSVVGTVELASSLEAAVSGHTKSGSWGVLVASLTRGDTLYARNADVLMLPASTMKMYTAAVALDRFGPDHVFKTPIVHDGTVEGGAVRGNVYLRGVGDPSLSMRFWKGDSPLDALARQVAALGITRIEGDVVGDASVFDGQLIPNGWKTSYLGAAYAARVAALSVNEGLIWVVVQAKDRKPVVTLDPESSTVPVTNTVRVVNGSGGSITASRTTDGSIVVRGTIGATSPARRYSIVADNPPVYVAGAIHNALTRAGITVTGSARVGPAPAEATPLAAIASPPLSQIVGEMNRESINVVAEMLFRAAAATPTQVGSAGMALGTLRQFLTTKVGVPGHVVDAYDGSGLSELDRVTPRSMVHLLGYAHASPWSASFHASLPVEGESGTLRTRARGTPAHGNLHAKTGTTNSVASLGGYVTARNGEIIAFAFIYNGTDRWNARTAMDRMGATLADWMRETAPLPR